MTILTHPARHDLEAYLFGKLADPIGDEIAAHLEVCPECDAAAADRDQHADSLMLNLKGGFLPNVFEQEPILIRLLESAPKFCPDESVRAGEDSTVAILPFNTGPSGFFMGKGLNRRNGSRPRF